MPLSNIQKIMVKKRGKGALQGAGLGFLSVLSIFTVLGTVQGATDPCESECILSPKNPSEGFALGLAFGIIGGVIYGIPGGAVIGAIKGANTVYIPPASIDTTKYSR